MATHHILKDGTSYAISGGSGLVNGTKYQIGGGRTLIDGTVYEIGFEKQVTYVISRFAGFPQFEQYINFTSNGMTFVAFQVISSYLTYKLPDGTRYYAYNNGRWTDEAWKTVTFEEKPTGDLLTWLQANAVQQ